MKKAELKIKQELTCQETVDLFNEVGKSISEGVLTIEYGDKKISLKPGCRFDTAIEASRKKNKQKLVIEVSWKEDDETCEAKPALKISSEEPVVEAVAPEEKEVAPEEKEAASEEKEAASEEEAAPEEEEAVPEEGSTNDGEVVQTDGEEKTEEDGKIDSEPKGAESDPSQKSEADNEGADSPDTSDDVAGFDNAKKDELI